MQVKTESTESMGAFTVTKFVLKNSQESDATKVVRHFRFTNWPDKGIPDVKEFAHFIRSADKARLESPKSPIVVHC
ncbi:receptor-type tyrosine- phosphatase eta, partial [Paramuricea clavata]